MGLQTASLSLVLETFPILTPTPCLLAMVLGPQRQTSLQSTKVSSEGGSGGSMEWALEGPPHAKHTNQVVRPQTEGSQRA